MIDALQRRTFLTCLKGDFDAGVERGFFPIAGILYGHWTFAHYGRWPAEPRRPW